MACPKVLPQGFGIRAADRSVPTNLIIQHRIGYASPTATAIYLEAVGLEEREFASGCGRCRASGPPLCSPVGAVPGTFFAPPLIADVLSQWSRQMNPHYEPIAHLVNRTCDTDPPSICSDAERAVCSDTERPRTPSAGPTRRGHRGLRSLGEGGR
jgi:hypothetical protein